MEDNNSIFGRNVPGMTNQLQRATVGVAGCGGLGSNSAVAMVRAGIGHLILADFDTVEASNLNRQYFFRSDIGKIKVFALADHLKAINPEVKLTLHNQKLEAGDIKNIFGEADLLLEAFDRAESKHWLIDAWGEHFPDKPIIVGNGISGLGHTTEMKVQHSGNIYFCGDMVSEMSEGLCAARVAMAASMQANVAIALLLKAENI